MVDPKFIIDVMRENPQYRFFAVMNPNYELVYSSFQDIPSEDAIKRLEKFMTSTQGQYKIALYPSGELNRNGLPKSEQGAYTYDVNIVASVREPQPVQGIGNVLGGGGASFDMLDRFLNSKDDLALTRVEMAKMQMEIEKNREIDKIKQEYDKKMSEADKNSGINGIINSLLPELAPHLMGMVNNVITKTPINGINDAPAVDDKKSKVISAVNILMKLDPDFADNISDLAELATRKPEMYKMAIGALKKFK